MIFAALYESAQSLQLKPSTPDGRFWGEAEIQGLRSLTACVAINPSPSFAALQLDVGDVRRGVHTFVRQLEADIRSFIDRHNQNPKPFKWTKSADQILASVKRFRHKAQQTLCGEL
jgi:hypothetical protein